MTDALAPHLGIVHRHAPPGLTLTSIPRLEIRVGHETDAKGLPLYRSMVCFILQGSRYVAINDDPRRYDAEHYIISAIELPRIGPVVDTGGGQPYIVASLVLDLGLLAEVASIVPPGSSTAPSSEGITINPITRPLRDTLLRLLSLLDTPDDIPGLAPMVERELLYRLLQGPQGRVLRQIARPEGALSQIRRAVDWIRDNSNARFRIGALCDATGMSRASLHRHFLAMTGLTPLQYQKQIRLIKARHLLLGGDHRASNVAFSVGYESASQFNREYSRQFGAPPARDVRQIRQVITNPTSS